MRYILTGMATLALAACGGPADKAAQNVANATDNAVASAENAANAVNYVAEIGNLSETEQQGVLKVGRVRSLSLEK